MEQVVQIVPGYDPWEIYMDLSLGELQRFCEGYIEVVTLDEDTVLICNEEGKVNGMEPNFVLCCDGKVVDIIFGPAIICGRKGDEFAGLPDDKLVCIKRELYTMNRIEVKKR